MKILVINGVNLNMLGKRDKTQYGSMTLPELEAAVFRFSTGLGVETEFYQSNFEGDVVQKIQSNGADGIVLNAGAHTHYSYAIRDAVECCGKPVVEVHLSDVEHREEFRKVSVLTDVCAARFFGEREASYYKAVEYLKNNFGDRKK